MSLICQFGARFEIEWLEFYNLDLLEDYIRERKIIIHSNFSELRYTVQACIVVPS